MTRRWLGIFASIACTFALATTGAASAAPLTDGNDDITNRPVRAFALGDYFTCAVTSATWARCWGDNRRGELGNGAFLWENDNGDPQPFAREPTDVRTKDSLTVSELQRIKNQRDPDVTMYPKLTKATAIAAHHNNACAIHESTHLVRCWGANGHHQLGMAMTAQEQPKESPLALKVRIESTPGTWNDLTGAKGVAVGNAHACALLEAGTVFCWGSNKYGQLGNCSASQADSGPVQVMVHDAAGACVPLTRAASIVSGATTTCVRTAASGSPTPPGGLDRLLCWGSNAHGQLSPDIPAGGSRAYALPVSYQGSPVAGLLDASMSERQTCVVRKGQPATAHNVWCWGKHANPDMSTYGSLVNQQAIATGDSHMCGLAAGKRFIQCFGANSAGQLGDGFIADTQDPRFVRWHDKLGDIKQFQGVYKIAVGKDHSCATITSAYQGDLYCWGSNAYGQIGLGTPEPAWYVAIRVAGLGAEHYD